MRCFFMAHASLEMQLNEEALEMYGRLRDHGLAKSTYVMVQIALAHQNLKGQSALQLNFLFKD